MYCLTPLNDFCMQGPLLLMTVKYGDSHWMHREISLNCRPVGGRETGIREGSGKKGSGER